MKYKNTLTLSDRTLHFTLYEMPSAQAIGIKKTLYGIFKR